MPFFFLIQNFAEIWQSVDELWPKKRFSRWRPPPSWILKISIIGHVTVIGFNICFSVPNFIKIGWFFTEIWWFSDLKNGGRLPSWICYDLTILHRRTHFRCHGNFGVAHALYHVILSRGVQNNHLYEIFGPYLPIHYATFMRLRWRLRGVLRWASPLLNDF